MKNTTLKILSLVIFILSGCGQQQAVKNDQPITTSPSTNKESLESYVNNTYHFSLQLPKKIYSTNCQKDQDVKAIETKNIIEIGAKFNCKEQDPKYLQGFTIYAANNINTQQDTQTFLDKTFGKGCKVSEWGNPNAKLTENDSNAFFIESLNSTNDNPFGDCQFSLTSKYRTFYSPRLKTIVFWSLTQEPQFTYKEINYDEEMLNSFNFTK